MFTGWGNSGVFRLILPHFIYYFIMLILYSSFYYYVFLLFYFNFLYFLSLFISCWDIYTQTSTSSFLNLYLSEADKCCLCFLLTRITYLYTVLTCLIAVPKRSYCNGTGGPSSSDPRSLYPSAILARRPRCFSFALKTSTHSFNLS